MERRPRAQSGRGPYRNRQHGSGHGGLDLGAVAARLVPPRAGLKRLAELGPPANHLRPGDGAPALREARWTGGSVRALRRLYCGCAGHPLGLVKAGWSCAVPALGETEQARVCCGKRREVSYIFLAWWDPGPVLRSPGAAGASDRTTPEGQCEGLRWVLFLLQPAVVHGRDGVF
ncbi:hypothetical protein NDU88_003244 [Pleurodeles waltl]|uniref:Uncharacterized protein n=1 Tax=Pleurodeles waltl TaxID=8319 RepID=A0AAV7PCI6_PLEWA|nr:hypothetical protein NDU88_003244 [Pleurodeles waltl]